MYLGRFRDAHATRRYRAPQRHTPPDLKDLDVAAEFLDCHNRTVRRMIRDGKLRGCCDRDHADSARAVPGKVPG